MYRKDRPVITDVPKFETLYIRFQDAEAFVRGDMSPRHRIELAMLAQFRAANQSFNRRKFSEPFDVLFSKFRSAGVLRVRAAVLFRQCDSTNKHAFFVRHVPLWNNYGHAELFLFKGQSEERAKRASKTVETKVKEAVGKWGILVRWPTPRERFSKLKRRRGIAGL